MYQRVWGVVGYFIITLLEITVKSVGWRILKIGQHLAKLGAKYSGTFSGRGVHSTLWVNKKQATIILPITSTNVDWFSKFIHYRFTSKFATKSPLPVSPHLNPVTTLPCEISVFKNCHAQDLSIWSKLSCKTQPLKTVVKIPYSHFIVI